MFEILVLILFAWLTAKALGLGLRLTWGAAKIVAALLFAAALPLLVVLMLFAGGALLLLPLGLIAACCGVLRCAS